MNLRLLAAPLVLLLASPLRAGPPLYEEILARDGSPGPCARALAPQYARIAAADSVESCWAAQDLRDGTCRVAALGAGAPTYGNVSPRDRDREASYPAAERVAIAHVHPLDNAPYFGGESYRGEIMFADAPEIAARSLDAAAWKKLIEAVRAGRAPGFNLSPPSMQDLEVSSGDEEYNRAYRRVSSVVLTSGGAWTYSVPDPVKARKELEDLVIYANMYELSRSAATPPALRDRARLLFDNAMKDATLKSRVEDWAETALGLRAPYSSAALAYLEAGDDAAVRREYAEKLRLAKKLSDLLATLGVEASFAPF